MATNQSLKKQLSVKKEQGEASVAENTIKSLLKSEEVKKSFENLLKQRAPQYMSNIMKLVNSEVNLQTCHPMSIIKASLVAAALDLPLDKALGYAWIVPYKDRASFYLGYKGYIQLALRSGDYKSMNVIEVHEGELISWNPLTEELEVDLHQKESDAIIGYAGYFQLSNGFKKSVYWSKENIEKYRKQFCKSDYLWKIDYAAMAKKTVVRNMLSKWGILSTKMEEAFSQEIKEENQIAEIPLVNLTVKPSGKEASKEEDSGEEIGIKA